jgi:hypothetical protein
VLASIFDEPMQQRVAQSVDAAVPHLWVNWA